MQAVKRNADRFPQDFVFQLSKEEVARFGSRSQIVTLNNKAESEVLISRRGQNIKYLPYAFTEQGVAMLSTVLRSKRAIQVNIEIMRTFVKLRRILSAHKALAHKLAELEKKYDGQFKIVFDAIRGLMTPAESQRRRIGFHVEKDR